MVDRKDGGGGKVGCWSPLPVTLGIGITVPKSRDAELSVFKFHPSPQTRYPALVANILPRQFLIHHHGRPQDFVGANPLHFQPAAEAQHGLNLAVRAAGLPYRGQDQGKLAGAFTRAFPSCDPAN